MSTTVTRQFYPGTYELFRLVDGEKKFAGYMFAEGDDSVVIEYWAIFGGLFGVNTLERAQVTRMTTSYPSVHAFKTKMRALVPLHGEADWVVATCEYSKLS